MSQASYALFIYLCDLCYVLLQVTLFLVLWRIFYNPTGKKKEVFFVGIFIAVNVLLRVCPSVLGIGRYVVSAVLVLGYCCIKYKAYLEKAVFTLLLFYNFHGMSFLISNSIYQTIMDGILGRLDVQNTEYIFHMYKSQMIGQSCNLLFYSLSFILMTWILKKMVKSPLSMNWQDAIFLSALNVVGSMLTWMIIDISVVQIDKEIFFLFTQRKEFMWKLPMIAVLLCTGELSAIFIFQKYKELQNEKEKHFVEKQQMKAMARRLEEAENFYGSIRKVRHEMKSHMANIKGLVAGEKYEEVEKYIEKLDETIQELDYKFSTGNAVTDVIINDKYQRAVKLGIAFHVRFEYQDTDTIPVFDIGIVLNNLLDNAIEACEKLEQAKRDVSLTLKRKNHFLLIQVKNSFDGKLVWENEKMLPTTMKYSNLPDILMEHGIGLKNVKEIAERYLGSMDIQAEETVFKVTVMLQQKELSK